mgnify:CR=1
VLQVTFHPDLLAGFEHNLPENGTVYTIRSTGCGKFPVNIIEKMQGWIILGEVSNRGTFKGKFFVLPPVIHHFLGCLRSEWLVWHGISECFLPNSFLDYKGVHGGL